MSAPRLLVVGGLNMDIHLFDVRAYGGQAELLAEHYLAEPGGKGANQARAAARLGAEVVLVGAVGDDEFGHRCVEAVAGDGVDVERVEVVPDEPTGFVAIELVEGQHRSLVFAPGANERLHPDAVLAALADGPFDAVVIQAEVPPAVLAVTVDGAARAGVPLFVDPAPPERVTRAAVLGAEALTPDLEEGGALTGRDIVSPATALLAARDLRAMGARRVLLKLDAEGTLLADDDGVRRVPTVPVTSVDETGAGDVFLAALVVARLRGDGWVEAVRYANAASSWSVERPGLALPTDADVEANLDRLDDTIEDWS